MPVYFFSVGSPSYIVHERTFHWRYIQKSCQWESTQGVERGSKQRRECWFGKQNCASTGSGFEGKFLWLSAVGEHSQFAQAHCSAEIWLRWVSRWKKKKKSETKLNVLGMGKFGFFLLRWIFSSVSAADFLRAHRKLTFTSSASSSVRNTEI